MTKAEEPLFAVLLKDGDQLRIMALTTDRDRAAADVDLNPEVRVLAQIGSIIAR